MPAFAGMTNLLFAGGRGISTIPEREINSTETFAIITLRRNS